MTEPAPTPAPPRRRRRAWLLLGLLLLAMGALVAWAPWLLNTRAGNRLVAGRLARVFAPGKLRFASIRFSWTTSTRLVDVELADASGKAVVTAPLATLTPSLWGLVTSPDRLGTLGLDRAAFDVERRPDGTIDLAEALGGILQIRDRKRDLTIRADRATLRLRAPEFPEPVTADAMDVLVHLAPAPEPTSWSIDLARRDGPSLRLKGEIDRWQVRGTSAGLPDLEVAFASDAWPFRTRAGDLDLSGTLGGRGEAGRTGGLWRVVGASAVSGFRAVGPPLRGQPFDLSGFAIDYSVEGAADDSLALTGRLTVADPPWPMEFKTFTAGKALSLSSRATFRPDVRRLEIAELALATPIGSVRADGRLDAPDGRLSVDLKGSVSPDWDVLTTSLAERVEPGAKLKGGSRPFHLKGSFAANASSPSLETLAADFGVELTEADVFGMRLGPTPVVVRVAANKLSIDPIETTLNGGKLRLDPSIDLDAEGGPTVRLGEGSSLTDATINEEVSRRVLSYVAPILDRTTRASGKVSLTLEDAEFPLNRDLGRKASVTGSVLFRDVEFAPGPLARQVVGLIAPNKDLDVLRLDEPVELSIADGRVNQRGLAIPIGNLTRAELEGWVDFDRNIALVVSFPGTPAMFPNRPLLADIVTGAKFRVPIGGTLSAPKLDKEAFNAEMKELGKDLLTRSAGMGALKLLENLTKPRVRDPDAPPPPTAQERKALRIEKRNERRRARGLDPLPVRP